MNEHTKLLIMKAGGIICSTEATGHIDKIDYLHFDAEKFAELIVRECAFEAFKFWLAQDDCNEESAQAHIKQHFGVEE